MGSFERLRIFSSPTCVGLRYGHEPVSLRSFSRQRGICSFHLLRFGSLSGLSLLRQRGFPCAISLHPSTRPIKPCGHNPLRHSIDKTTDPWYGILTCFPSPTPLGLGLGPTNPGRINLPQETSGLRRTGFSPVLSLLVPTFSLLLRPALLAVCLLPTHRTLPYRPM